MDEEAELLGAPLVPVVPVADDDDEPLFAFARMNFPPMLLLAVLVAPVVPAAPVVPVAPWSAWMQPVTVTLSLELGARV